MNANENRCGSPDFCLDDGGCDCGIPGNDSRSPTTPGLHTKHDTEEPAFLCASGYDKYPTQQACGADPQNCGQDAPTLPLLW